MTTDTPIRNIRRINPTEIESIAATYVEAAAAPLTSPVTLDPVPAKPRLADLIKSYAAMRLATAAEVLELFADTFAQNPYVKAMVWYQYTPYFNDGDACTFRLRDDDTCRSTLSSRADNWDWIAGRAPTASEIEASFANSTGDSDNDDEYMNPDEYRDSLLRIRDTEWDGNLRKFVPCEHNVEAKRQVDAMKALLHSFPEDILERVFGEHTKVFVWAGGIAVTEYDHE